MRYLYAMFLRIGILTLCALFMLHLDVHGVGWGMPSTKQETEVRLTAAPPSSAPRSGRKSRRSRAPKPDTTSVQVSTRTPKPAPDTTRAMPKRKVPRAIYKMISRPVQDTTQNGQVLDMSRMLERFAGKTIGRITVERQEAFDPNGPWYERAANKLHVLTLPKIIRRDLLFHEGEPFDPQLVVRNMQLLRSRSYISEVDIRVQPDPADPSVVNLVVTTRDSWTIALNADFHSEGRTMVGLSDASIFGTGHLLRLKTHFDRRDFTFGGEMVEYVNPNVLGSFYTADFTAGRAFYNSILGFGMRKEFLRSTDYEAGFSYLREKDKYYMIEEDSSRLARERNIDLWGGYSYYLPGVESSAFLTGHYNNRYFGMRPEVSAYLHPALHNRDLLLGGLGLYRERFLTANMIYGFGQREYLAAGYKAEVVGGYMWGEFYDAPYIGLDFKLGGFGRVGYIMGGFSLGSFITDGTWHHSAVDVDLRWFSNLISWHRSHIRQFLGFNYTQGWNRTSGNNESIRFTEADGPQALKEYVIGTNRMVLNSETVLFSPYQPWGFHVAFFGFFDVGTLGYAANPFANAFYSTLGVGLRLRNERLVFNTIQIRLGVALGKPGFAECDYFRLSSGARLEQYRYRPTRPEITGFK